MIHCAIALCAPQLKKNMMKNIVLLIAALLLLTITSGMSQTFSISGGSKKKGHRISASKGNYCLSDTSWTRYHLG